LRHLPEKEKGGYVFYDTASLKRGYGLNQLRRVAE